MWIERLHLNNYRCFENFEIAFRPGLNVIAGVNGSGKTSLLMGLSKMLAHMLNSLLHAPLNEAEQVRIHVQVANGRFRFEPQYPVAVSACVWFADELAELRIAKHGEFD